MPETTEIPTKSRDGNASGFEVKSDMTALRADMEKLVQDVASLAREQVSESLNSSAKLKDAMNENITVFADRTRDYVRDNPLGACATAAAAGFAIALLLKR
jgi:ElaB/YqjD/DUF883 family membrane-anchored ribosome-binding protein